MIVCHRCGKENQNHYKFCLGCGAELTGASKSQGSDMGMMKTMVADVGQSPTPPGGAQHLGGAGSLASKGQPAPPSGPPPAGPPPGVPAASTSMSHAMEETTDVGSAPPGMHPGLSGWGRANQPAEIALPPPGDGPEFLGRPVTNSPVRSSGAAAGGSRTCPECNATVPPAFRFCGVCGFKMPDEQASPAARPAFQPDPYEQQSRAFMTLIRPDGSEGGFHELVDGENKIGRNHGEIFENDGYLSPTHAVLIVDSLRGRAIVRDLDSLNGVFVKMTDEEDIEPGQVIRIGQELLRFDLIEPPEPLEDGTEVMGSPNPGYWGKITVIIGKDVDGSAYPLLGDSVTLGRERGEINFPDDGYVSGLHARLSNQRGKLVLTDLGSSNGTFIKVKGERELTHSSFVLLGQQLFRLSLQ